MVRTAGRLRQDWRVAADEPKQKGLDDGKPGCISRRDDGAQEADDGQRLGVKRRLDGELASARVNDDDAKEGDTIMVDAAQMAAAAAAGTDRGTKRLLHVALAARDGKHIPDIQNTTALVSEIRQLLRKTPG